MAENEVLDSQEVLTEEQVWDVLRFAEAMTDASLLALMYDGVFNPLLVNARLKDITLNPELATIENVETALLNPKENEDELQAYSEHFELSSMIYKRMLGYLGNLLAFDLVYLPINAKKEDYSKPAFKKDRERVHEFLDKFNVIKEFKTIVRQLIRQEVFYGVIRESEERYTLQELPRKYCKIDGRWEYGLLYAFDMTWFVNSGVDIDMYPDIFKEMYKEAFMNSDGSYIPSKPLSIRSGNSYANWVDTSPVDGFWAFKLSPEIITNVPYLSALFPDLVLQPTIRALQKDQNIIASQKILFGEVPMLKDMKGAVQKDQVAVSPEILGKFLGLLKKGIADGIKVATAPLENMQAVSFPLEDRDMYDSYLKTTTASSGINSRLIFSTEKPTAVESQLSVDVDEFLMTAIYPMFEEFLNYEVNKRTKRYKFKFEFEGTEFSTNRKSRFETQMKLAENGIVMPQKISASIGMLYQDMIRHIELGQADEFSDMLAPLLSAYNISQEERGRPQKDVGDLTDSGNQTRDDGGNVDKGGEV